MLASAATSVLQAWRFTHSDTRRSTWSLRVVALGAASIAVFASRALFLPPTLEDIDSVNFALALAEFNPARHQPHPPGYPVYVAAARLVHLVVGEPARALALLSALSQAAAVWPLFALLRALGSDRAHAIAGAVLVLANPLVWFTGARPMSDSFGLLAILVTQALLLRGRESGSALAWGSLAAGITCGVRLQAAALVLPLWIYMAFRSSQRLRHGLLVAAGIAIWLVPLLIAAGGPHAYVTAFAHVVRDVMPTESLVTGWTVHRTAYALMYVFVSPWGSPVLGATMAFLAVLGLLDAARHRPAVLGIAVVAFLPYLSLHFLFQEVRHLRYALPYVPFLVWLAVQGGVRLIGGAARGRLASASLSVTIASCCGIALPALWHYRQTPSPPYAAMAAVESEAQPRAEFVLGSHFAFFRYLDGRPSGLDALTPVPNRSVLGVTEYWRSGGTRSVLFLANRRKRDLEVIDPASHKVLGRWEWPDSIRRFAPAARPQDVELLRLDRPAWFAHEGWSLAYDPPFADLLRLRRREAFLTMKAEPTFLLLAGEPLALLESPCALELELGGTPVDRHPCDTTLLRGYELPPQTGGSGYMTLAATSAGIAGGAPFALRGLDYGSRAQAGVVRGNGWHHAESDERGTPFRWIAQRAVSLLHVPPQGATLRVDGTAPLRQVGRSVHVEIEVDGTVRRRLPLDGACFRLELALDGGAAFRKVELRVTRSFVPARVQRTADRRELAARIYEFRVDAQPPGPATLQVSADTPAATPPLVPAAPPTS